MPAQNGPQQEQERFNAPVIVDIINYAFRKCGMHPFSRVAKGGTLKGSDDVSDYDLKETRIEGETCTYFTALINADGVDGFTMCGPGTIDGNGLRSWKAFWLRRKWNPKCTNKDEQRPRLVYLSNCRNVLVADLSLQNAHFWTNHLYRCDHVKYLNCNIFSPATPVKSPSTDALDIEVCTDVLVKGCYMEVNDDSVVLKGGKGYVLYGKCTEKFHRKTMVYWLEASEEEVLE